MTPEPSASESFSIDLPEVQMHLARPNEPVTGKVVRTELCTNGGAKSAGIVRHVEIDVSGTPLAGSFCSGQSFGVIAPGTDENGKPHKVRLYSIASPSHGEDGQGRVLSTTVKRVFEELGEEHKMYSGVASNHICDLQVGDPILVTGPNGKRFLLPARPEEHDYIFIATGTGIAPFRGMVADLLGSVDRNVTLIMGAPYETDLLYHDHFTMLDREHERFSYVTALSRESSGGAPKEYVGDALARVADQVKPSLLAGDSLVYVCGIAGMELGVLKSITSMLESEPAALARYIDGDEATLADRDSWDRRMIHRAIKPTRRVFLEVY